MQHKHAVGLGNPDHVHSAAVPAWALELQVPSARLHQVLSSLYAQPNGSMPAIPGANVSALRDTQIAEL